VVIQRRKVQRAFTGLAGRFVPDDEPVSVVVEEPPALARSKAALRAERYRERQKARDPEFGEKERLRKETERADKDREAQIAAVLAEKEPELTAINADGERVRVISGGFGSRRIAGVDDKSEQVEDMDGRRVTGAGAAPANYDKDAENSHTREHDNQFVRKAFQHVRTPREVKAMKAFIYSNVEKYNHKSELTICSHCKTEITPFPSYVPLLAFQHFRDEHPNLFQSMMAKVKKANEKPVCIEDHASMVSRYAGGGQPVQCRRCRKILWRPGDRRRKRSDKVEEIQALASD
jgi:hypothetical protein